MYISDLADEFRIEISGRFSGNLVSDVAAAWRTALSDNLCRRVTLDINRMTGYDRAGYSLLREIHTHGTHMTAGTPRALLFLSQISSNKPAFSSKGQVQALPVRAAAVGE